MMQQHIRNFPDYLAQGQAIAHSHDLSSLPRYYHNIIFVGMGGSGMASNLIATLISQSTQSVPTAVVKDYHIPNRVNEHTLMIVASYSGNTEETIAAMQAGLAKGAHMIAITSGGKLLDFAQQHHQICITMPKGIEPRAALPYSLAIQLSIIESLKYLPTGTVSTAIDYLDQYISTHQDEIQTHTKHIAQAIQHSIPAIYATPLFTGIAIRLRQQLNENSRMVCRHHIIPEMNHNELLGRQEGSDHVHSIFVVDPDETPRNQLRYQLTQHILAQRNIPIHTITASGPDLLTKMLTSIYIIDRLSYHTAICRGVNPDGMEIVERLKAQLNKHPMK